MVSLFTVFTPHPIFQQLLLGFLVPSSYIDTMYLDIIQTPSFCFPLLSFPFPPNRLTITIIFIYIYTHIYYIYVYMHTHMYICIKFFVQYTRVISLNWQVHFSADTHITLILLERLLVLFGSSQEIWNWVISDENNHIWWKVWATAPME
jgi:hypothetical protein